jgi:hypothetical protein
MQGGRGSGAQIAHGAWQAKRERGGFYGKLNRALGNWRRRRLSVRRVKTMKPKTSSRLVALGLAAATLATLATNSGCLAVAAGAGAGATVAYVRGDLDTTLGANLDHAARAVNKAIAELKFAKVSETSDALQAIIIARNAADRKIELHLNKLADDATKLKIRVGTFGDDLLQVTILEKIKANL